MYNTLNSKEENIGFAIYEILNKNLDDLLADNIHFEIINDFNSKNVFFSYALKLDTNIREVEKTLMNIGIHKQFINKSNNDKKQYLAVWK